jgi:hypothetical protein
LKLVHISDGQCHQVSLVLPSLELSHALPRPQFDRVCPNGLECTTHHSRTRSKLIKVASKCSA